MSEPALLRPAASLPPDSVASPAGGVYHSQHHKQPAHQPRR